MDQVSIYVRIMGAVLIGAIFECVSCFRATDTIEAKNIDWLRIFEPFEVKVRVCELKGNLGNVTWHRHLLDLSNLPSSLAFLFKWKDLMALSWAHEPMHLQYAFVGGDQFMHPSTSGHIGWCYRLSERGTDLSSTFCVCGAARQLQDPSNRMNNMGTEYWRLPFRGCNSEKTVCKTPPLKNHVRMDLEGEEGERTSKSPAFQVRWQHPNQLVVGFGKDGCQCAAEYISTPQHRDNSIPHGIAYCVVEEYVYARRRDAAVDTRDTRNYLMWAACFDQEHRQGWFKADTARYGTYWRAVCDDLGGSPAKRPVPARGRLLQVVPWRMLCKSMQKEHAGFYRRLQHAYAAYARSQPMTPRVSASAPIIMFASGPPGSGKSLSSLSSDIALIQRATGAFPSMNSTYFENNIMEGANVDRMVEKSDLLHSSKDYLKTKKGWLSSDVSERDDSNLDSSFSKFEEEVSQKEYWYLRKDAHFEDLANAHLQRLIGSRQDLIYETTLSSVDWLLKYEMPKIKQAGYESLLINLVVPIDELVLRLSHRAEEKGQTPASRSQLEKDVKVSPTNFMRQSLLSEFDYAVAFTHVGNGKEPETVLAAYAKGCFTECADAETLQKFNVPMMTTCSFGRC